MGITQDRENKLLKNKNCFLTGATGGIGRQIAIKMAESGCNLFLTASSAKNLGILKEELTDKRKENVKIFYEPGNLNKIEDIRKIIDKTKEDFGSVDILINCAGVFLTELLQNSTLKDFDSCFDVNVKAPFLFCQAFSQSMMKNRWGRIVNIGSSSAYSGFKETSIYCASKHALLGFSRSLQDELGEYGIRTFCVSPGSVKTKMGRLVKDQDFETFINPQEIAEYIIFIISFDGGMISDEIRLNRVTAK